MTPNREPFSELAKALAPVLYPNKNAQRCARKIAQSILASDRSLDDYARELSRGTRSQILLLVDQFEELYTVASDPTRTGHFIDQLLEASSFHTVVAYRGDFHDRVTSHPGLAERLRKGHYILGAMSRHDLTDAIERPAQLLGRPVDPSLTDHLLDDVGHEPGNLPLLEFVLRQLWEGEEGLNLPAYLALGGLRGSLARHADWVYERQLKRSEHPAARRIFLNVVQPSDTGVDTRRRIPLGDIAPSDRKVADKLASSSNRLLIVSRSNDSKALDVVHESLIRSWPRLRRWLDEEREFLLWRNRLRVHFDDWKRHRNSDGLLAGYQLAEASRWLDSVLLSEDERAFIAQSAHAEEMRRQYATALSHQMRMPLSSILGYVETLLDPDFKSQKSSRRFLKIIRDNASQLSTLQATLDELARFEIASPLDAHLDTVSASLVAAREVNEASGSPEATNVSIVLEECRDLRVLGSERLLARALRELISNAVRFNNPKGRVVVRLSKLGGGRAEIRVSDTGLGIPRKHLPLIFERFYRVHGLRSGLGLGLSFVSIAVANMKGRVIVKSKEYSGSTFRVLLTRATAIRKRSRQQSSD